MQPKVDSPEARITPDQGAIEVMGRRLEGENKRDILRDKYRILVSIPFKGLTIQVVGIRRVMLTLITILLIPWLRIRRRIQGNWGFSIKNFQELLKRTKNLYPTKTAATPANSSTFNLSCLTFISCACPTANITPPRLLKSSALRASCRKWWVNNLTNLKYK